MLRVALISGLLIALAVPGAASAGAPTFAKFSATFEAKRTVEWDQPRGVNLIDCKGEHFYETHGSETWTMRTAKPQKLIVQGGVARGMTLWRFGTWDTTSVSSQIGLEVKGPRTREYSVSSGTSGGWCRPGYNVDPQPATDCGTRLSEQVVHVSHMAGTLLWSHTDAPWMRREKLGFDTCISVQPDDVSEGEFPRVPKRLSPATLFNRRQKRIVVTGSKTFGPTGTMVPNYGVERSSKATVTWKLTLLRRT